MIFFNPKINTYLQKEFNLTDQQMQAMAIQYSETVNKMIINEALLFAEKNKVKEYQEIKDLINKKELILTKNIDIFEKIVSLVNIYPKLTQKIQKEILKINDEVYASIISSLTEEQGIEILKMIDEEIDYVDRYTKRYLTKKAEK